MQAITLTDVEGVFELKDLLGQVIPISIPRGRRFTCTTRTGHNQIIYSINMPATIEAMCIGASRSLVDGKLHPVWYTLDNFIRDLRIYDQEVPYPGKYLLDLLCDLFLQQVNLQSIRGIRDSDLRQIRRFDNNVDKSAQPFWVNSSRDGHFILKRVGSDCSIKTTGVRAIFTLASCKIAFQK